MFALEQDWPSLRQGLAEGSPICQEVTPRTLRMPLAHLWMPRAWTMASSPRMCAQLNFS